MMALDQESIKLLERCSDNNSPVYLSAKGVDVVFQTKIISVEETHVTLLNTVRPQYISAVRSSDSVQLQAQMARFSALGIDTDGVNIIFPLDALAIIAETREAKRFPFDPEERVICELLNPYDSVTRLAKAVMDMSATGLSIRTSIQTRLFEPGTLFEDLHIKIDGEPYTRTSAKVVYSRKLMDLDGKLRIQVGLKIVESEVAKL